MRNVKDDIKPFRHTFKEDNANHSDSKFDNIDNKVAINDFNDIKLDTDKSFQNMNKYNKNNSNKENQFKPVLALDDKQNNTTAIVGQNNN
jgi:hypothetical protein